MKTMTTTFLSATAVAAVLLAACGDNDNLTSVNDGHLVVRLSDAGAVIDSLKSVDVFVVRIDGRVAAASDADAESNVDQPASGNWIPLAAPNASFNLLALQDRVSSPLGDVIVRAATYEGFRIIIDPSKSSVTLSSGRVLIRSSSPGILFPSANRIGIRIAPSRPVVVVGRETTTLIVDFDVANSFVQRGTSIERDGLLFQPVIGETIIDAGTNRAAVRFINLSHLQVNLQQDGRSTTKIGLAETSSCLAVNPAQPLSVSRVGSNALSLTFGADLVPGLSYVIIAFDTPSGAIRFVTLTSTFTPVEGQAGLRVLNATALTSGLDVFLTTSGAPTSAVRLASVLRDSASAFVNVPAGVAFIRLTDPNRNSVLLDLQAQTIRAGQRLTLVVQSLAGSGALSSFLFEGC
jgi:hypothetical protein